MYNLTAEQAMNFWNYCTVSYPCEMHFYLSMPKIFEGVTDLYDDNKVKRYAEFLGDIINDINPPEDGQHNKAVYIMSLARAYVKYLDSSHHNNRFLNPGSFALICRLIAKNVI